MKNPFENRVEDFPLLAQKENGKRLIYFDNGATAQRPRTVIDSIDQYYRTENANPHRGAYRLSEQSTAVYEGTRVKTAAFIGASSPDKIIFTRNATESLNLIAYSYGLNKLKSGDEIVITILEHHSNLVPWQMVAQKTGAILKYVYAAADGTITVDDFEKVLSHKTKLVGVTQMSNAWGNILPVKEITQLAHKMGAVVVVDGAQSIPHMAIDVQDIDCDFFAFSGHKMLAGMGAGVLYGKREFLDGMPPFLYGGDMIEYVTEQETTFAPIPAKFEAGTQNVAAAASLSAAIDYYGTLDMKALEDYERELTRYAVEKMEEIPHISVYGTKDFNRRGPIISFNIEDVHPHDVSTILDNAGICIRAGHHCAQPLMQFMEVGFTCRATFAFYNTKAEVDIFCDALKSVRKWMGFGS